MRRLLIDTAMVLGAVLAGTATGAVAGSLLGGNALSWRSQGAVIAGGAGTNDCVRYDDNGAQGCTRTADELPNDMLVTGQNASPISTGANQTGQDVTIAGGWGIRILAMTQANCNADTITYTCDNGTSIVGTEDGDTDGTAGTDFTCNTTDAGCATNVATWLAAATGVEACAGTGCTDFTGVAGTAYAYKALTEPGCAIYTLATSDATCAAITSGTDGQALLALGTEAKPSLAFLGDGDTGFEHPAANTLAFATGGTERWNINSSGHLMATDDNTYDIGATAATRPKDIHIAGVLRTALGSAMGTLTVPTNGAIFSGNSDTKAYIRTGATNVWLALQDSTGGETTSLATLNLIVASAQTATCADGGGVSSVTVSPIKHIVNLTNNDADGCNVTIGEINALTGMLTTIVVITNAGGNVNFADTAGVSELAGAFAADVGDTLTLRYTNSAWYEADRSAN